MPHEDPTLNITIDEDSGIPIWLQLRNRLIFLITSGFYEVGDKLPTVREMAAQVHVNYNTVAKVYQDIERDGYIQSKRGKGTFVSDAYHRNDDAAENLADSIADAFIQQCREAGVPQSEVLNLVRRRLEAMGGPSK